MGAQAVAQMVTVLGLPFLACLAMSSILGYIGLHVLRREIVFVDIAMAQMAAVGAISAHLVFGAHEDSLVALSLSLGLTLAMAVFYALARRTFKQISLEAVIGVSYAVAAAWALLLLGVAPGGHVHAQHMLAGSILWTSWPKLASSVLAFLVVGLFLYLLRRPFDRLSDDYHGAVREGMHVVAWDALFYSLIGVVITFAVRIGGVVLVFAFLVIPATVGTMLATRPPRRLLAAWGAGVLGTVLGMLFAHRLDFSVGPSVALFLGVVLAVAWLWQRLPPALAAGASAGLLVAYALLLAVAASSPFSLAATPAPSLPQPAARRPAAAPKPDSGLIEQRSADSAETLVEHAPTAGERCAVVLGAFEQDLGSALELALQFLEDDPPLFFRQAVVDALNEQMDEPVGLDVMRPFADPENRAAVKRLRGIVAGLSGGPRAGTQPTGPTQAPPDRSRH